MYTNKLTRRQALPVVALLSSTLMLMMAPASADHPAANAGVTNAPTATTATSGGVGAVWNVITTLYSGNPHTDLDFFRKDGDLYVAAGTLAAGGNDGGQIIHRLTVDGVVSPSYVSVHPSASCVTDPLGSLGLQHDVEVTPKGDVMFNTEWGTLADRGEPQLLLDATDAEGRCHDQVSGGLPTFSQPKGGLEIIDITDVTTPVEIGLTSHAGEAHTVNVDPKRSHIAYVSSSDGSQAGFEVVDLSSCMNFPDGTAVQTKRDACRPVVYRFEHERDSVRGTYSSSASGCHELEVYPEDKLTCASINGSVILDLSAAFNDNGTPNVFTDDIPNGTPLPCAVRESVSNDEGTYATGAMVTDCVVGEGDQDLTTAGWNDIGRPSLEGVEVVSFINHAASTARTPDQDVQISHEAELTASRRFLIVSDERGGGVVPPDAACPEPGTNSGNLQGNGGIHAYAVDRLHTVYPGQPGQSNAEAAAAADVAYALTPSGDKAIYRATPRVAQSTFCTAHVFQQIPGQNRLIMGWYTQGTQVIDFIEHEDGTFEWVETAWWVPESASTWTSAIFAMDENPDGSFTYYGATSDFGRQAVDVYSVTLPGPPPPLMQPPPDLPDDEPPSEPPPAPPPNPAPPPAPSSSGRGGVPGAPLGLIILTALGAALIRGRKRSS